MENIISILDKTRNHLKALPETILAQQGALTVTQEQATSSEDLLAKDRQRVEWAKLDQKTTLISNISQEFRTPLMLMLEPLNDILRNSTESLPLPIQEQLQEVQQNGLRLLNLVDNLLDSADVESEHTHANGIASPGQSTIESTTVFPANVKRSNILECITDAFVAVNREWRYTHVNQEATRLLQKTQQELLGQQIWEVFPDVLGTQFEQELKRALIEQVIVDFEEFYLPYRMWVKVRVYPSKQGLAIYFRDITQRKIAEEALRESEMRFAKLAENVPGAIYQYRCYPDRTDNFTYISSGWLDIFEIAPHLVQQDCSIAWQSIHPDDLVAFRNSINLHANTGERWQHEYRIVTPSGKMKWIQGIARAERQPDGSVLWDGILQDISERKLTEEALRQSEERLRVALKNSPISIFHQDDELRYTWVHNSAFGYEVDEILNQHDADLMSRPDAELLTEIKSHVLKTGIGVRREVKLAMREQDWYYDLTIEPLRSVNNEIIGVTGAAVDISERKRSEMALRKSEQRFRIAQEISLDAFTVMEAVRDDTGDIVDFVWNYVNPKAAKILQQLPDALIGKRLLQVLPGNKTSSELFNHYVQVVETGQPHDIEIPYNFEGISGWFRNMAVKLEDGIAISFSDITQRKKDEQERVQLLERERVARAEAESANRIKDEFLAVLSHELRSPLNPILGWSQMLRARKYDKQTTDRALETIERNAKLQAQLIDDLLDISRILRGKMILNLCPVNLITTIEAAIETVSLTAQAKAIEIQKILDPNVGMVSGDTNRLQQVVLNLLSNAIKFTPNQGKVEVRLECVRVRDKGEEGAGEECTTSCTSCTSSSSSLSYNADFYAQITVKDNGKGISADFLPHIFDYFRQENSSTTRQFGGLGLGLAIVRYFIEMHGGFVIAESQGEGLGATFTIRLPLISSECCLLNPELTPQSLLPSPHLPLRGLHVLIVDDEADIRELVAHILKQFGAEVTATKSASEVITALEQSVPDVLISDIGMPNVNGYMLMRQIRTWSPQQGGQIPAIALTAYAGEYNQEQALAAGFQMHIAKPVEPDTLVKAVVSLVSSNK